MINLGDYRRFSTVLNHIVLKPPVIKSWLKEYFSTVLNYIVLKTQINCSKTIFNSTL